MIDQTLEEGLTAETVAGETLKRYHDLLAGARNAADARFTEAQAAVEEERRERLAEAERQAGEAIVAGMGSLRQASEEAMEDLRGHADSLAEEISGRVLG
jgi:F0F1-type ATP synthase membrane subunit b/b'